MRLSCDLEDQEEWITTSHSCVTNRDTLQLKIIVKIDTVSKYSPWNAALYHGADIRTAVRTITARVSNQGIRWSSMEPPFADAINRFGIHSSSRSTVSWAVALISMHTPWPMPAPFL